MENLSEFRHRGVAALVALQGIHLQNFYNTWKEAAENEIILPQTTDPDYKSLDTLLFHVFNSSKNYVLWICRNLNIPMPEIHNVPNVAVIRKNASLYLEHLSGEWKNPLKVLDEKALDKVFKSNSGIDTSIEAMLEHAVMHPIRHEYQLKNLIQAQSKK